MPHWLVEPHALCVALPHADELGVTLGEDEAHALGDRVAESVPDPHTEPLPVALLLPHSDGEAVVDSEGDCVVEPHGVALIVNELDTEPQPLADCESDTVPLPHPDRLPESDGDGDIDELCDKDTVPH